MACEGGVIESSYVGVGAHGEAAGADEADAREPRRAAPAITSASDRRPGITGLLSLCPAGTPGQARRVCSGAVSVAIIGGTGDEGFALTLRLARAGEDVIIGSRSDDRGRQAAERAAELLQ